MPPPASYNSSAYANMYNVWCIRKAHIIACVKSMTGSFCFSSLHRALDLIVIRMLRTAQQTRTHARVRVWMNWRPWTTHAQRPTDGGGECANREPHRHTSQTDATHKRICSLWFFVCMLIRAYQENCKLWNLCYSQAMRIELFRACVPLLKAIFLWAGTIYLCHNCLIDFSIVYVDYNARYISIDT